ncbi:MAG TPA: CpsD/CapB family tyrosine-protein kinase [Acidobacteriota bacterium]|jgi:capsular exopolysaccharide synthesis family protein
MSRIFDALQRSELNGAGFEFSELVLDGASLAAEVLRTPEPLQTASSEIHEPGLFRSLSIAVAPNSRFVCLSQEESLAAEKFRFLGVRLGQLQHAERLKKLLITSTIPEEGKSVVAGNLAVTLARRKQQRVLLLEGDLRRPQLAARFGLRKLPGLSEWLRAEPGPITNIYHLEEAGLWFLPAGKPPENPLELMQSGRLPELMEQLSALFDWIVIDSPPVLPLADTTVWARAADGVLLVTREGTTQKRQLERGLKVLQQSKLLGVVVNSSSSTDHKNYYQRYGPIGSRPAGKLEEEE